MDLSVVELVEALLHLLHVVTEKERTARELDKLKSNLLAIDLSDLCLHKDMPLSEHVSCILGRVFMNLISYFQLLSSIFKFKVRVNQVLLQSFKQELRVESTVNNSVGLVNRFFVECF